MIDPVRVLLVEDEADYAVALQYQLEFHGCRVELALSAPEALATLATSRPDVVVIDIMLPPDRDVEGIALARSVRDTWGLPVLILTNRVEEDVLADAVPVASAVLQKNEGGSTILSTVLRLGGRR